MCSGLHFITLRCVVNEIMFFRFFYLQVNKHLIYCHSLELLIKFLDLVYTEIRIYENNNFYFRINNNRSSNNDYRTSEFCRFIY